jgi:hypothetical protein
MWLQVYDVNGNMYGSGAYAVKWPCDGMCDEGQYIKAKAWPA